MKIPSESIAQTLLKPLDAEAAAALLDSGRGALEQAVDLAARGIDAAPAAAAGARDAGELVLAADVWNGVADRSRLLPLSDTGVIPAGNSSAIDASVDAIVAGLV